MTKPLIGISTFRSPSKRHTTHISVPETYVAAVSNAGAIPVLIPFVLSESDLDQLHRRLDGVLLTGGGDVDPQRFGAHAHPAVHGVDPERDRVDIQLAQDAIKGDTPLLGICRGLQVINVALGGTLYTDIADQYPDAIKHDCFHDYPRDFLAHPVKIDEESSLAHILGKPILEVNSLHHQAVRKLAPGLQATAYAPDGIMEAFELSDHPYGLAVQWHPEWLPDHPASQALFNSFVLAAANGKS